MAFLQYEQEYVFEFLQASSLFLDKLDKPIAYVQLWLDSEIAKKDTWIKYAILKISAKMHLFLIICFHFLHV